MDIKKRLENQKEFPDWTENEDGSRVYWFEIKGKLGWKARYVKETDKEEITLKFYQEYTTKIMNWSKFTKNIR
jgi:hypothetical protein